MSTTHDGNSHGSMRSVPELMREALSLARAGRREEAERRCREVLAGAPQVFEALALLGMLRHQGGDAKEADVLLARACARDPGAAHVRAARAAAVRDLGRHEEALELLDEALALRPDFFAALINRGNTLLTLERYAEALATFDDALALQPDDAGALTHRGIALLEMDRVDEALASHGRALELQPDHAAARVNRGNALRRKADTLHAAGRHEEALPLYEEALVARADLATALGLGNALQALGRFEGALAACERALAVQPESPGALNNRGNALRALGRHQEALASYARVLALQPDNINAHWNEGLTRLTLGDFERGWDGYEWRRQGLSDADELPLAGVPTWGGSEDLEGKTILLCPEQGFGDAIQFVRYASLVAQRGAEVTVVCREPLVRLFRTVPGVRHVIPSGNELPRLDYQTWLMSLPLACATRLESVPATVPYMTADPERVAGWRRRFAGHDARLRVGLVWRGNPEHPDARTRDCPAELLAPLLQTRDCDFFSLQLGEGAADIGTLAARGRPIVDLAADLGDFYETAAAIEALDLVISVDTATAHLAGALGRPTWLLLQFAADWRWLLDRDDSPWYPSLRLFRQTKPGGWQGVLRRVSGELAGFEEDAAPA